MEPPTTARKTTPSGRSEAKGSPDEPGTATRSSPKATPPRQRKPSQNMTLQKATAFVISAADRPQAE
jgi:hypothetical protein